MKQFRHRKSLGQNFLKDKSIIETIIEGASPEKTDLVIEIGPGMGALTSEAVLRAGKLCVIEIDKNLIPHLQRKYGGYDNFEIIHGDVLKIDLKQLAEELLASDERLQDVKIIGNLPYYITTPIIMKILEEEVPCRSLTVMMQKEVGDRIRAVPGSKTYGALSVAVQYYCTVDEIADVPRSAFVPQPKVDSKVLRLNVRDEKPVELLDEKRFFAVIRAGFHARRKTLLNSLTGLEGMTKDEVRALLESLDIDPARRAETLTTQEFAAIANSIKAGE